MDVEKLSEQYNRALLYKKALKTPFYKELGRHLEHEIELTAKGSIYPGYESREQEHDALVAARAYKKLLLHLESRANAADRLRRHLEDSGVKVPKE